MGLFVKKTYTDEKARSATKNISHIKKRQSVTKNLSQIVFVAVPHVTYENRGDYLKEVSKIVTETLWFRIREVS